MDGIVDEIFIYKQRKRDEDAGFIKEMPWLKYNYGFEVSDARIRKQLEFALKGADTEFDRTMMYFIHSNNPDIRESLMTNEIHEYLDLSFFWEKFGLKPWEVEMCDANWVQEMIMVANAESMAVSSKRGEMLNPQAIAKMGGRDVRTKGG